MLSLDRYLPFLDTFSFSLFFSSRAEYILDAGEKADNNRRFVSRP